MVKELENYDVKQMTLFFSGLNIPINDAIQTKKNYEDYKAGVLSGINQDIHEMEVLSILESLGYPMDELGTYLYKDVILNVINLIKRIPITRKNMHEFKELLAELKNAFSQFYFEIAREEKDIGVKPFHLYIERAIDSIDVTKIDENLAEKIYGNYQKELDYGTQAFMIAAYTLGIYNLNAGAEFKMPRVKRLGNMPRDTRLKYNSNLSEYV